MLGSARGVEMPTMEEEASVREPWYGSVTTSSPCGSVARVEYLTGIGWVSRDPWPQSEKRSPR